jgi:hypothetical protein
MDHMLRRVTCIGCLLVGLGCEPDKPAVHPVVQMAPFDLQCPKGKLHFYQINDETWGVRGCGKQAKYVRICHAVSPGMNLPDDEECRWVQN